MSDAAAPGEQPGDLQVLVVDEQDDPLPLDALAALARAVLVDEGVTDGWLTLAFVQPDAIAALKAEHLGIDEPTDVLAFPLDVDQGELPPDVPRLLGDVIICPQVARANVGQGGDVQPGDGETWHAETFEDELALLVVHGILHLRGHDHGDPTERSTMRSRERDLLDRYHSA